MAREAACAILPDQAVKSCGIDSAGPGTEGVCAVLSGQSLGDLVAGLMGRAPTEE